MAVFVAAVLAFLLFAALLVFASLIVAGRADEYDAKLCRQAHDTATSAGTECGDPSPVESPDFAHKSQPHA